MRIKTSNDSIINLYQRIKKMGSEKLLESNHFIWASMCLEEFNKIVL